MDLLEHQGKQLLAQAGLARPARRASRRRRRRRPAPPPTSAGRVVIKAQVPAGKRGKAGAIRFADDPRGARARGRCAARHARSTGYRGAQACSSRRRSTIARELYAAVLDDAGAKGPLVLFSTEGGMDIEEVNADARPSRCTRCPVDIREGLDAARLEALLAGAELPDAERPAVAAALVALYAVYARRRRRAWSRSTRWWSPTGGGVVALDARSRSTTARAPRQRERALEALPRPTGREPAPTSSARAPELGLLYIELDGDVGVLANGAGLTMTTTRRGQPPRRARRRTSSRSAATPTRRPRRRSSWCCPTRGSRACWSTSAAPSRAPTS